MIQVQHLCLAYDNRILCPDVSFSAKPGELLLLAGPNGSGKTTLLRMLSEKGMESEICSHPRLHKREGPVGKADGRGREATISDPIPSSDSKPCVFIPTGIPKVKGFTVEEFVRTGCFRESNWAGRLRPDVQERMDAALALLGLTPLRHHDIASLSDGEFQKACIAVGLTRRTQVLLLDEPTAYLDVENRLMVLRTLEQVVAQTGTTILFSSHDLHEASRVAHRVLAFTPEGQFLESTTEDKRQVLHAAFPTWQE